MQLNLVPHPATPPSEPFKVWVNVEHSAAFSATATTNIWFGIGSPASRFVIPEPVEPRRADDLWQTTCFEAFLRVPGAQSYREWNFAPSGEWAAYDFTAYRDGRTNAEVATPYIRVEDNFTWWAFGATISVEASGLWEFGLSAVLEETDGTKSYWALTHPVGDKPDFHDAACFAAHLP
ncbi:MAG: hypothetical protein QOD54_1258 [Sphingomonadales bacterium]|nr:hypothetical protein [Sphingomonadales bacterium]